MSGGVLEMLLEGGGGGGMLKGPTQLISTTLPPPTLHADHVQPLLNFLHTYRTAKNVRAPNNVLPTFLSPAIQI